jgi:hypothetical protein
MMGFFGRHRYKDRRGKGEQLMIKPGFKNAGEAGQC